MTLPTVDDDEGLAGGVVLVVVEVGLDATRVLLVDDTAEDFGVMDVAVVGGGVVTGDDEVEGVGWRLTVVPGDTAGKVVIVGIDWCGAGRTRM